MFFLYGKKGWQVWYALRMPIVIIGGLRYYIKYN